MGEKHGKGGSVRLVNRAIIAEAPGGEPFSAARRLLHESHKWGDPADVAEASRLLSGALIVLGDAGDGSPYANAFAPIRDAVAILGRLLPLCGTSEGAELRQPLLDAMAAAHEAYRSAILQAYTVAD